MWRIESDTSHQNPIHQIIKCDIKIKYLMHQNSDVSHKIGCDTSKFYWNLFYQNIKHQIHLLYQSISLIWHIKLMCRIKSDISHENLMGRIKSKFVVTDQIKNVPSSSTKEILGISLASFFISGGHRRNVRIVVAFPKGKVPLTRTLLLPHSHFWSPTDPPPKRSWPGLVWHPPGIPGFDLHGPGTL